MQGFAGVGSIECLRDFSFAEAMYRLLAVLRVFSKTCAHGRTSLGGCRSPRGFLRKFGFQGSCNNVKILSCKCSSEAHSTS